LTVRDARGPAHHIETDLHERYAEERRCQKPDRKVPASMPGLVIAVAGLLLAHARQGRELVAEIAAARRTTASIWAEAVPVSANLRI
jgi:hypothetical protein